MSRCLFFVLLFVAVGPCPDALAREQSVLVVHSYHEELAWTWQCSRGIREALGDMEIKELYLDSKRLPEPEYTARAESVLAEALRLRPEVVMLGDDNALRLLGERISAAGIPVVFFGINNNPREYFKTLPDNVTGVLESLPLFPWMRYLGKIVPHAAKMLVLMDDSATSEAIINVTFKNRRRVFVQNFLVEYKIAKGCAEWQRIVQDAGTYDLIVMPTFHVLRNELCEHIPVEEVVRWTSANSPVPVFSHQDYTVGDEGLVGAYVIFGEAHGRQAGEVVRQILEGKNPRDIPAQMDKEGLFYFNRRQLRRYRLTLPQKIADQALFK